ncbi:MAG: sulfate adenylyltransferase subunit 1 [Bosea sp. (in: a-proteobacteria)]
MRAIPARLQAEDVAEHGAGAANDDALAPRSLLRFITCGSVDDGKSTLIGRLLFDTGAVPDDQLGALERDSRRFGTQGAAIDFALLVDGLSAEREQGITIDVAYRYFDTQRRSFIVADTPGHEQYTRNMATGASTADLAIILIDARLGLLKQTLRHSFIVSLVGVRQVVVAVNKMDLVDYDQAAFARICDAYRAATAPLGFAQIVFIPLSARDGDNVTRPSQAMPWHAGPTLLAHLETVSVSKAASSDSGAMLPVQWVNRPDPGFRGYAGNLASGRLRVRDEVVAWPSARRSRIARILAPSGEVGEAVAGQSVTVTLADQLDVSRGDVIAGRSALSPARRELQARLLWTGESAMLCGGRYLLKLASATANAVITGLDHSLDMDSFEPRPASRLAMNDIGRVSIALDKPLCALPFAQSAELGGFILIDRVSLETVAFGFVEAADAPMQQRRIVGLAGAFRAVTKPLIGGADSAQIRGAGAGHAAASLSIGIAVQATTGDILAAATLALADLLLRPLAMAAGAWAAEAMRQRGERSAGENLQGDGI